jgi:hypothetical protein
MASGRRHQRLIILIAVPIAVVIRLIILAALSHGATHTLGPALGLPVIGLLLLIALRLYRKSN